MSRLRLDTGEDADSELGMESVAMSFLNAPSESTQTQLNELEEIWRILTDARHLVDGNLHSQEAGEEKRSLHNQRAQTIRIFTEAPSCEQPGIPGMIGDPLYRSVPSKPSNDEMFVVCRNVKTKDALWLTHVDNKRSKWIFNPQKKDLDNPNRYRRVPGTDHFLYFNWVGFKPKDNDDNKELTPSSVPNVYWIYQRASQVERASAAADASSVDTPHYMLTDDDLRLFVLRQKYNTKDPEVLPRGSLHSRKRQRHHGGDGRVGGARGLEVAPASEYQIHTSADQVSEGIVEFFLRSPTDRITDDGRASLPVLQRTHDDMSRQELLQIANEGVHDICVKMHEHLERMLRAEEDERMSSSAPGTEEENGPPGNGDGGASFWHSLGDERWPDYVLDPNFLLPTVQSVVDFAREHGHLPGIVNAAQVESGDFDARREIRCILRQVEILCLWVNNEVVRNELRFRSMSRSPGDNDLHNGPLRDTFRTNEIRHHLRSINSYYALVPPALPSPRYRDAQPERNVNENTLIPQRDVVRTCLYTLSLGCLACTLPTAATSIILRVLAMLVLATAYGLVWSQLTCELQGAVKAAVPTLQRAVMKSGTPLLVIRMSQKFASSAPENLAFFGFVGAFVHCLMVVLLVGLSRRACDILEQWCTERWGSAVSL